MRGSRTWRRRGVTLIELLVVLAIGAILLGLLLFGILRVREAAARAQCQANLLALSGALHQHHALQRLLPSNGGWDGKQKIKDKTGAPTTVWVKENYLGLTFTYGVGAPRRKPRDQTGSWAYAILPFLRHEAAHNMQAKDARIQAFNCPSRRAGVAVEASNDVHGTYQGGGWQWAHIDYAANAHVIPNRPRCLMLRDIVDGLSNTIVLGEKAMRPDMYHTGSWYWDEPYLLGGSGGTQRGFGTKPDEGTQILRDSNSMDLAFRYNWGAPHSDGAHFLFADGSVRMIRHGTAPDIVKSLLTPRGGELIPNDI